MGDGNKRTNWWEVPSMKFEDQKKIGVGVMGGGIEQVMTNGGYEVIVRDLTDEVIERGGIDQQW
jgi:3-hydroxyacyl-CoA dehydrogenase